LCSALLLRAQALFAGAPSQLLMTLSGSAVLLLWDVFGPRTLTQKRQFSYVVGGLSLGATLWWGFNKAKR
jgi:hypothetical protein